MQKFTFFFDKKVLTMCMYWVISSAYTKSVDLLTTSFGLMNWLLIIEHHREKTCLQGF